MIMLYGLCEDAPMRLLRSELQLHIFGPQRRPVSLLVWRFLLAEDSSFLSFEFSAKPGAQNMYGLVGSEANAVAPEKRMLSSM